MFHAIITHMAITPSLRFLYIFGGSGLLCAWVQNSNESPVAVLVSSSIINVTHPKKTGLFLRRSVKKED